MEYIYNAFDILMAIVASIITVKIYMLVANYIGEQIGIGKFLIYLWGKIRKKKIKQYKYKQLEVIVSMDDIIQFIFDLFKSKDPEDTAYNDSINLLIFILLYFSIIVAFFWLLSKFGLFG